MRAFKEKKAKEESALPVKEEKIVGKKRPASAQKIKPKAPEAPVEKKGKESAKK